MKPKTDPKVAVQGSARGPGKLLLLVVALVLIGTGIWITRISLLQSAARLWIVTSEPLSPADAVAVLGGGIEVRPYAAAEYYRAGLSGRILVSDVRPTRSEKLGIASTHETMNRKVLLARGVPEAAIESFGHANRNTHEEVLALRDWAACAGARSLIVPTEVFSSRRVRWALDHGFDGSGVKLQVAALDTDEYGKTDWWLHEQGLIAFQNEVLKYIYYRFKY